MSIATLKKKTQAKYNNSSVGLPHFSINGTHRSQGYVGQTSLSRSLPRTLMNGVFPRGHGGCCGTFIIHPIIQSGVTSTENPNIIKSSVTSSKGMMEEKLNCINSLKIPNWNKQLPQRSASMNIVKPDGNRNQLDQSVYLLRKAKKTIQCTPGNIVKKDGTCKNLGPIFNNVRGSSCSFTKPASALSAISQGERLIKLNNKCVDQDQTFTVSTNKTPIAC